MLLSLLAASGSSLTSRRSFRIPYKVGPEFVPAIAPTVVLKRPWIPLIGKTPLVASPGCLLSFHRPYSEMFAAVRRDIESRALTVVVTHWWEYFRGGVADEKFIQVLHEVAAWLASRKDIRVVSFRDVANGTVPLAR